MVGAKECLEKWNSEKWNSEKWNSEKWNSEKWNSEKWNSEKWNSEKWNSNSKGGGFRNPVYKRRRIRGIRGMRVERGELALKNLKHPTVLRPFDGHGVPLRSQSGFEVRYFPEG